MLVTRLLATPVRMLAGDPAVQELEEQAARCSNRTPVQVLQLVLAGLRSAASNCDAEWTVEDHLALPEFADEVREAYGASQPRGESPLFPSDEDGVNVVLDAVAHGVQVCAAGDV